MNKGEYHDYVVTDNTLELSLEPGDGVVFIPMYTFISHKYPILVRSTGKAPADLIFVRFEQRHDDYTDIST